MKEENLSHFSVQTNNSVFTKYSKRNNPDKNEMQNNINYDQIHWYNINKKDINNQILRDGKSGFSSEFECYHIKRKELPNTKRVLEPNYQDEQIQILKPYQDSGSWNALLSRTSPEESILSKKKRNANPKTFQSEIFPDMNKKEEEIRHMKKAVFEDHLQKTQITTLPGGVKWDKYKIKDDKYYNQKNSEAYKYKLKRDFNSDLDYNDSDPIGQGYNVMEFPTNERFQGSYKLFCKENDIFNLNKDNHEIIKPCSKKQYKENRTFKSQIIF